MACPVSPLSHASGLADSTALSFCPGIFFCTQTCQICHLSKCIGELYCSLCILTSTLHCPPPHLCSLGTAECVMCKEWAARKNPGYTAKKPQKSSRKLRFKVCSLLDPGMKPESTMVGTIVHKFRKDCQIFQSALAYGCGPLFLPHSPFICSMC